MGGAMMQVEVAVSTKEGLDVLAAKANRSSASLAAEALAEFVRREQVTVAAIERGRAQIRAGQSFTQDEVFAEILALVEGEQLPP